MLRVVNLYPELLGTYGDGGNGLVIAARAQRRGIDVSIVDVSLDDVVPDADLYLHEMPGGQFTNLRQQARGLGLDHRWNEVCRAYAEANRLFGDIVKVTPSSKVVGDMALFMVSNDLTADAILSSTEPLGFPRSVVEMIQGEPGTKVKLAVLHEGTKKAVDIDIVAGPVVVACDGRRSFELSAGGRVRVTRAQQSVRFARVHETTFTERLVAKFQLPVTGWRRG